MLIVFIVLFYLFDRSFYSLLDRFAVDRFAVDRFAVVYRRFAPIYHLQGVSPIYSPQGDLPSTAHRAV
jgi:hypothetical protein